MATIKFRILSGNRLYLRLKSGNILDKEKPVGILINPDHWDQEKQQLRNLSEIKNRSEINLTILKLHAFILDEYNMSFMSGVIIDGTWLETKIKKFFNRPAYEIEKKIETHKIFYSDFCDWWIKNKSAKFKVAANKYMDDTVKNHYINFISIFKSFESKNKVRFTSVDSEFSELFSSFLIDEKKYAVSTAERMMTRFKFFCARAEEEGIDVNKSYKKSLFIEDDDKEFKKPYLNEDEINLIFKKDLSFNETLENVRDNFIIGLWTGLRVSDFLTRLDISNIKDDFIEIKTKKTKTWVSIPIHPHVQFILNKRAGLLPPKISEQKFNDHIKSIAQICDIDQEMVGSITKVDKKTKEKRNVVGTYKKYELITSHICRRSFATNLFGKVPNPVICDIGGWKTESMMLHYIQRTSRDSAMIVKKHWENQKF